MGFLRCISRHFFFVSVSCNLLCSTFYVQTVAPISSPTTLLSVSFCFFDVFVMMDVSFLDLCSDFTPACSLLLSSPFHEFLLFDILSRTFANTFLSFSVKFLILVLSAKKKKGLTHQEISMSTSFFSPG